jgi:ATP-binding cassette subfamily B protein
MLGLGIYYMVQTSAMLTLIIICFLIICIVVISILAGKISNSSVRHLNSCDKYKQFLREDIVGLKTIKATNSEDFFVDKNNKLNSNIVTAFAKVDVTNSTMNYIFTFFSTFTLVLIYFFASVIIKHGFSEISVVDIIYFSILSGVVSSAIVSSAFFLGSMPYNFALFKRINMILKFKSSADSYDKGKNISDLSIKGNLIFNNVSFKYPNSNELTLENISFSIRQGETLAIVGPTGSGKTTLINLIPKLIKLTEGEIIFDGVFINDISLKALRSRIGYISQKNILLNDTIYENISFGVADNKKNLEDVVDSAKISNAGEFVEKMPEKYQSYISENASNLSGGQKQRIAIARALIIKPEFLIFDDSFSALDFKTDLTIRKNIKKTMNETTFIIVAQRISTIINADKIVVLNKGKMVGYGKHTDLFEKCEIYREMVINQLGEKADTGGFDA